MGKIMMGILAGLALRTGIPVRVMVGGFLLIVVLLALWFAFDAGRDGERDRWEAKVAAEREAAQERNAKAREAAEIRRAQDTAQITTAQKGRDDAIRNGAAQLSPRQRLACERLRAHGTAADRLPVECRLEAGVQARPAG